MASSPRAFWPFAVALLLWLPGPARAARPPGPRTLREGLFLLSRSPTPPAPDAPGWERVRLPDLWRETRPTAGGTGWYRFALPAPWSDAQRWAVYLPRASSAVAVFVNGEPVGQSGRLEPPVSQNWNRPLFYPFSRRLLGAGRNRIDVRLSAQRGSFDRLMPIEVGPAELLKPVYDRAYFRQITLSRASTGLGLALVLFMGVIWMGVPRDPVYGYFVLAAGSWVVASLNYHWRDPPVPYWAWQWTAHYALDGLALANVFLVHRLLGLRRPRLERAVVAYAVVIALALAVVPAHHFEPLASWFHAVSLGLGIYAAVTLARGYRALPRADLGVFLAAATVFLILCVHDLLAQLRITPFDTPRLLQFGAPLILTAFAGVLTARFLRYYRRAENLNVELEERIREKHAELEENFAKMRRLEQERVLAAERERMMRELHDGMGGQLVSALALVEGADAPRGRIAEALRDSLADMRLVIHSLDPSGGDLETVLALARERIEPRLCSEDVRLAWRLGDLPSMPPLSPEQALHVVRIVEEAATNVLKHAGARTVEVSTGTRPGARETPGVFLAIRDDGAGFSDAGRSGRGLHNMRARARALGGTLRAHSNASGTRVELWLPLAQLADAKPDEALSRSS